MGDPRKYSRRRYQQLHPDRTPDDPWHEVDASEVRRGFQYSPFSGAVPTTVASIVAVCLVIIAFGLLARVL